MSREVKWKSEESSAALEMWRRGVPGPVIAKRLGRSEDSVAGRMRRLRRRGIQMPTPGSGSYRPIVQKDLAPSEVIEERNRRMNLPDTMGSLLCGDPKPGSGQSALEQMRR